MYDESFLKNHEFFKNIEEDVLEPFVKCINRKYIIMYIEYLIEKKISFTMTITDIDNFKLINDSYGHLVGDQILLQATNLMLDYFANMNVVVGRYGGDEFIIVNTNCFDYDSLWSFLKGLYQNVYRKAFKIEEDGGVNEILTTITSGSVMYPKDGDNYNDLFSKADKALYRGKQKGRNCFIIYTDEKHKNIDVSKRFLSVPYMINQSYELITKNADYKKGITSAMGFICNSISCTKMAIQINGENKIMFSNTDASLSSIEGVIDDSLFDENNTLFVNDYSTFKYYNKQLHEYCWNNHIKSLAALKLTYGEKKLGYLICIDSSIKRIWQQTDVCIFQFIAKISSILLDKLGE